MNLPLDKETELTLVRKSLFVEQEANRLLRRKVNQLKSTLLVCSGALAIVLWAVVIWAYRHWSISQW